MQLDIGLFLEYSKSLNNNEVNLISKINSLSEPKAFPSLDYYNQVSAVFSAKIEGNSLDLNSFLNQVPGSNQKEKVEIEDLLLAYRFAEKTEFNKSNLLIAHELLSKNILIKEKRGILRDEPVGVFSSSGLVYTALEASKLEGEIDEFFGQISKLNKQKLSIEETFYYASLIHMRMAHLHPFADGNGRIARLSEKWFLAEIIGQKSWWLRSEEYYWNNRDVYYQNLNLGINYYNLDYSKALPFLTMLPKALLL